jgi:hypothetical protein
MTPSNQKTKLDIVKAALSVAKKYPSLPVGAAVIFYHRFGSKQR